MRHRRSCAGSAGGARCRPGPLRGLSAFASLLLVFVQLSGALHLALTPHRFCPLHGLEDVHALKAPVAVTPTVVAARDPSSIGAPLAAETHGDPCVLASRVHDPLAGVQPADPGRLTALVREPCLVPESAQALPPGRALLLLAPKQGPPA